MTAIAIKLHALGIANVREFMLAQAADGRVRFPNPKPSAAPTHKRGDKWANNKERWAYYNQRAKERQAMG